MHNNVFAKNQGRAAALPFPMGSFAPGFWVPNRRNLKEVSKPFAASLHRTGPSQCNLKNCLRAVSRVSPTTIETVRCTAPRFRQNYNQMPSRSGTAWVELKKREENPPLRSSRTPTHQGRRPVPCSGSVRPRPPARRHSLSPRRQRPSAANVEFERLPSGCTLSAF